MRRILCLMLVAVIAAAMAGCAANVDAVPPDEETASAEASPSPAAPEPSDEVEMITGKEVIPANKPDGFEIDGRYTEVDYAALDMAAVTGIAETPGVKELARRKPREYIFTFPDVAVYSFIDSGGLTQYRVYGETWEYELNPKTREFTYADAPIPDSGALYPVILEAVEPEEPGEDAGNVMEVVITVTEETPVDAANEDFADAETGGEAENPTEGEASPPPFPSASQTGSAGDSSSGNTGSGNNGGGSDTSSDPNAGKTWHDAVYEDVWVVDVPESTREEPVYEWQTRTFCKICDVDITDNLTEHGDSHLLNGVDFNYYNKKVQVQTGTKTVIVPEQGHWEKKLVREAGYY